MTRTRILLLTFAMVALPGAALALIMGGEGNTPLADPGWPAGAAEVFNAKARVAWWEGPPFGGGQWHAECRGDAKALSAVLANFAKLDVKNKRVVLHDGVGQSFWLNRNNEAAKKDAAKIDWTFMVWQPANWERLRKLPADLNPTDPNDKGPPSRIDVYTGGNVKWADVVVPKGLEVVDERLEAHGFSTRDGHVVEGRVTDLDGKPLIARVLLQRIEAQKSGGYEYKIVATEGADDEGHFVLKNVPAGSHRVVVSADGFSPRVVTYINHDGGARWQSVNSSLARAAVVAGRVTDEAGKPLAGVRVRLANVTAGSAGRYTIPQDIAMMTGADGRFRTDQIPAGQATIWVHKAGYVRPGLGPTIKTPKEDVELSMSKSARITVTIDFGGKQRPAGYIVSMEPEGGAVVGSFGGSGNINAQNQMNFENVPPGKYILKGRPNPGADNQETQPAKVELKGGDNIGIVLKAK